MFNWSTDEKAFKKKDPKAYKLWRLVQLINYGLDGEKLDEKEVIAAWPQIKDRLDPDKAKAIECLIWKIPWARENKIDIDRNEFWQWYLEKGLLDRKATKSERTRIFQHAFRV